MKLTLTTPIPPSVNNLYTNGNGRRVLSQAGRDFKEHVGQLLMERGPRPELRDERLALDIRLYFKDQRRRDISNTVKLIEDALAEMLSFDDCAVERLHVERAGIDKERPRCIVTLETL